MKNDSIYSSTLVSTHISLYVGKPFLYGSRLHVNVMFDHEYESNESNDHVDYYTNDDDIVSVLINHVYKLNDARCNNGGNEISNGYKNKFPNKYRNKEDECTSSIP